MNDALQWIGGALLGVWLFFYAAPQFTKAIMVNLGIWKDLPWLTTRPSTRKFDAS